MDKPIFKGFLDKWLSVLNNPDAEKLSELISDEAVFYSPVVHTPQKGKVLTTMYLMGASKVLINGFEYKKKIIKGLHGVLEFSCVVDDLTIEGVDIIELNEEGKVISFKVMIRPLKALNKVHQKMGEILMAMQK